MVYGLFAMNRALRESGERRKGRGEGRRRMEGGFMWCVRGLADVVGQGSFRSSSGSPSAGTSDRSAPAMPFDSGFRFSIAPFWRPVEEWGSTTGGHLAAALFPQNVDPPEADSEPVPGSVGNLVVGQFDSDAVSGFGPGGLTTAVSCRLSHSMRFCRTCGRVITSVAREAGRSKTYSGLNGQ